MNNFLDSITPLVITFNEEPNIRRVLEPLRWARRIVLVDSFSTDATLDIAASYPNVEVFQRPFDSFARQCDFGLQQIDSDWVLSLDADHITGPEFRAALEKLTPDPALAAYEIRFRYAIYGRPLRGSLYPPRFALFKRPHGTFVDDGHGHYIAVSGPTGVVEVPVVHDDRKSLTRWLGSQARYSEAEVEKLLHATDDEVNFADRLRRMIFVAPFAALFYCLVVRGGIFDGWAGLHYAFQRTLAEIVLSMRLIEARHFGVGTTDVATRRDRDTPGGS